MQATSENILKAFRWHSDTILCTRGFAETTQKALACGVGKRGRFAYRCERSDLHAHTARRKRSRYCTSGALALTLPSSECRKVLIFQRRFIFIQFTSILLP